ncbi:MAG: PLP-dependent aspartate aminotransferase family protein [Oscillospiraceae bacterium]|jgi:cystathionine gamma-synthase|nr:PLP-dependent aspartate aminotransferase family protein [Oscillospiraceae bacterium]
MNPTTAVIHAVRGENNPTGAIAVPIFQSATFVHPGAGESTGYDYSRSGNPTREHAEKLVAALEHGAGALAFPSGMAAATLLMELLAPGDHIIATDDLYGGSIRLFDNVSAKNGLRTSYIDTSDLEAVRAAVTPATKLVFLESPTNPMMKVCDIAAIAELAHRNGILVAVDNTFLTPYLCNPLDLGADLVIHSGTKYLAGHNDTLAGVLVARDEAVLERLRYLHKTTGAVLSPFDAFLLIRGIKTLAIRMDRAGANALELANWLAEQPKIRKVYYTGLEAHPGFELSRRQARGFGAMLSFSTDNADTAKKMLNKVRIIQYAESLGGVESLLTYPMLQTHADIPEEIRVARGIDDCLLRMSVGIEHIDDLKSDLENAMK